MAIHHGGLPAFWLDVLIPPRARHSFSFVRIMDSVLTCLLAPVTWRIILEALKLHWTAASLCFVLMAQHHSNDVSKLPEGVGCRAEFPVIPMISSFSFMDRLHDSECC